MTLKLPDVTDFGPRPVPTPSGMVASYDPTQLGRALQVAGQDVSDVAAQQKEKQDRFELERARSYLLTKQVETQQALKQDEDFSTYEARYQKAMAQARADAAALISNPEHQQLFDMESQQDITRGLADVQDIVRAKQKDYGRATLTDQLEANRRAALTADPATASRLLQSSNALISGAYSRGYVSAEEGVKTRQQYAQSYAEDWLKMQPLDKQLELLTAKPRLQGTAAPLPANAPAWQTGGAMTLPRDQAGPSTADAVINHVIDNYEGTGLVLDDAGKGPSKFGINQTANPGVDVKNLTRDQAVQIYKDQYWNAINADQLPANLRLSAFDAAVNFGPGKAKEMLAAANNDPTVFNQLRKDAHAQLVADNPEKYGKYADAWAARDQSVAQSGGSGLSLPRTGTPVDFLPADKKAELMSRLPAMIKAEKEQQQSAILDQAMPIIEKNNGDWTAIPDNIRQQAMQAGIWNKIIEYKGVSNPDLVVDLKSMSPDKLAQIDFNDPEIKARLSTEDREGFAKQAQDYRDKPAEASLQQTRHDMVQGAFERLFPGQKLDTPTMKTRMANFQGLLDSEIAAYRERTKKNPEGQDVQGMVDGLLMNKVNTGAKEWSWLQFSRVNANQYPFDVTVPDEDRQKIISDLQAGKEPVTEGNILRLYLLKKGQPVGR